MDNYIPRQPIEIILNSKRGTKIGDLDGHKFFDLDTAISARKNEKILLYLKKAFIPFSFYCLSASQKNNKLDVKEIQGGGSELSYTITIPDGNYNINELLTNLKTQMEAASSSGGFSYTYTFTYEDATNKITMRINTGTDIGSTNLLFSTGTNKNNSCSNLLGFSRDSDVSFNQSSGGISDKVCDMADGLDSLHLKSNLVGDNIQSTIGAINGGELLIIPVNLLPNSILYFDEGENPFKHQLVMTTFKQIEIKFTDNNDNIVDFNDIPYTLIIIVEFIKDQSEIFDTDHKSIEPKTSSTKMIDDENNYMNLYKLMVSKPKK